MDAHLAKNRSLPNSGKKTMLCVKAKARPPTVSLGHLRRFREVTTIPVYLQLRKNCGGAANRRSWPND